MTPAYRPPGRWPIVVFWLMFIGAMAMLYVSEVTR